MNRVRETDITLSYVRRSVNGLTRERTQRPSMDTHDGVDGDEAAASPASGAPLADWRTASQRNCDRS